MGTLAAGITVPDFPSMGRGALSTADEEDTDGADHGNDMPPTAV